MKVKASKIIFTLTSVLILIALPVIASAQGRGRGLARGHNKNWKCGIFVNCHDARDGRWDNRGPRASRIGYRNGVFVSRHNRRFRNTDYDERFPQRRWRIRHRRYDNDEFVRRHRVRPMNRRVIGDGPLRDRGRPN